MVYHHRKAGFITASDSNYTRVRSLSGLITNFSDAYPVQGPILTVCFNTKESFPVFSGRVTAIHCSFTDLAGARGNATQIKLIFSEIREEIRQFCSEIAAIYA